MPARAYAFISVFYFPIQLLRNFYFFVDEGGEYSTNKFSMCPQGPFGAMPARALAFISVFYVSI